ncbi:MAG: thiamine diphosphokinase [Selenomonas noxia]
MYELKHNLILPDLRAALPYTPSQELIFIAGGRPPAKNWLMELAGQNKKGGTNRPVWAIDRGVNICRASALSPACLIGDGDSADKAAWTWATERGARVYRYPPEKDFTDTELALNIAVQNISCPLVILTAGFGGRLDHLISTAAVAAHASVFCVLADEREALFYLHAGESLAIECQVPPCAISLLPFSEECTGVSTTGLYWELTDARITNSSSLAISNVLAPDNTEKTFTVSTRSGILGVYLCHIK